MQERVVPFVGQRLQSTVDCLLEPNTMIISVQEITLSSEVLSNASFLSDVLDDIWQELESDEHRITITVHRPSHDLVHVRIVVRDSPEDAEPDSTVSEIHLNSDGEETDSSA